MSRFHDFRRHRAISALQIKNKHVATFFFEMKLVQGIALARESWLNLVTVQSRYELMALRS